MRKNYIATMTFLIGIIFSITSIKGQEISTVGDIYDFEIGDEYHSRGYHYVSYGGPGTDTQWRQIDEIIDKFYSPNSDTLFYNIYRQYSENEYPDPNWTYHDTIITEYYTNLELPIYNGDIDTVYSDTLWYNGRLINLSWYSDYFEYFEYRFVVGCGLSYLNEYIYYGYTSELQKRLVYYNKNGEEWGNPIIITDVIQEDLNRILFTVYPNPSFENIFLKYKRGAYKNHEIKIYDMHGRLVTHRIQNNEMIHRVDVSDLPAGVYILRLILDTKIVQRKFIKR